jgi:hypothetical protein
MRRNHLFPLLLPAVLLACSSDPAPPEVVDNTTGGTTGSAGTNAGGTTAAGTGGTTAAGTGGSAGAAAGTAGSGGEDPGGKGNESVYPAGPYGLAVGEVVQNFKFSGIRNPKEANYSAASPEVIAFSDYFNPGGDTAKPRFLVVTASARWCTFCKQEAQLSMKADHYPYWREKGVEFLVTLFDNETPGSPADFQDLEIWTKSYKLEYPSALDPNPPKLGVFFQLDAAPFNMILDLKTMKILFKGEGLLDLSKNNPTLVKATGG